MKKKGLLLAAAIGVCGTVCANTKVVSIEFKDLTKKSFVLSESPKFQYRNDSLVVNGSASTAYPFQNVSKFYFEDSEELEDEVVECEKLISLATKLLETVRDHYLPS